MVAKATIGRLNYQIGMDTTQLRTDTKLSRSEIGQTKRLMKESRSDTEAYAEKIGLLEKAYQTGNVEAKDYRATLDGLQSQNPEVIAATKRKAEAERQAAEEMRQSEQLTRRLMTAEERHSQTVRKLNGLKSKARISEETYQRALKESRATLPSVIASERRLGEERSRAAEIVRRYETSTERYGRELNELNRLKRSGVLAERDYQRALAGSAATLRSSSKSTSMASQAFSGLSKNMFASAAAAVSVGVVIHQTIDGISSAMDRIDSQAKTARKLGFETAGDLVGIQLAASEFSGLDANTTNTAIQRLVRRVAEAAAGTGEARSAIRELRLDAQELSKLNPHKQFLAVSAALKEVKNQGDAVRLTMKLVDSEGVALVNTLQAGPEAISQVTAEAERLGLTFNSVDAAKIEAANDSIGRAKASVDGMFNQLAIDIAPVVTQISKDFVSWRESLSGVSDSAEPINELLASVYTAVTIVGDRLVWFEMQARGMTLGIKLLAVQGLDAIASINDGLIDTATLVNQTTLGDAFIPDAALDGAKELNTQLRLASQSLDTDGDFDRLKKGLNEFALRDSSFLAGDRFLDRMEKTKAEFQLSDKVSPSDIGGLSTARSERMTTFAKSLSAQLETPLEKYADHIRKLQENRESIGMELFSRSELFEFQKLVSGLAGQSDYAQRIQRAVETGVLQAWQGEKIQSGVEQALNMKQLTKDESEAKSIQISLDRTNHQLSRIHELHKSGLLTDQEAALAEKNLLKKKQKSQASNVARQPSGAAQGSAAAYREITRILREQAGEGSEQKKIAENTKQTAEGMENFNVLFKDFANSVGSV